MSLKQATLSGAFLGRSGKTVRMPWVSQMATTYVTQHQTVGAVAGGTANTKGSWNQIIASTSSDISLIWLSFSGGTNGSTDQGTLLDIAVGASGSEAAVVQDIACGGMFPNNPALSIPIPVVIPSGSRVSMRAQCGVAGRQFLTNATYHRTNDLQTLPRSLDVIGSSTANSRGVAMSGASGTWVQITSSTSQPYQGFVIVPSMGGTSGLGNVAVRLTLGYGAAGSEAEIGSINFTSGGIALIPRPTYNDFNWPIGFPLPAGQRLAIKHDIAANPDRVQACVIGVPFR